MEDSRRSDGAALTARVKAIARACGADAVAIAPATRDEATGARMREALARGDLATWSYDDAYAETASDPGALVPGARSVVCVAVAYRTPAPRERRGRGRVSAYAWSEDYHRRMRALLERVAEELRALGGAARAACDTAPLAERAFAQRAGLGWIGKHTSVIVKGLGSAVFLGEVVTTLVLEPDAPLRTSCGACTRCVDVCPTGALRGDRTMDATRCISDLTQRRDAIPRSLRPLLGTWVWGCDLCNEACPPTVRGTPAPVAAFGPLDEQIAAPDLQALLRLRGAAFRERFARSAMGWRGATVLRRNAAVALGNALDRADVPALAAALREDGSGVVRAHAAWALGRIGSPAAYRALRDALPAERMPEVLEEIDAALEPVHRGGR